MSGTDKLLENPGISESTRIRNPSLTKRVVPIVSVNEEDRSVDRQFPSKKENPDIRFYPDLGGINLGPRKDLAQ
jgi:hypothetical protein